MKLMLPPGILFAWIACAVLIGASSAHSEEKSQAPTGLILIPPDQVLHDRQAAAAESAESAESLAPATTVDPAVDEDDNDPGDVQFTETEAESQPALDEQIAPAPVRRPLSPQMLVLRDRLRETLRHQFHRNLNTRDHNPWEMMHGVVAFGVDTNLRVGDPNGPQQTAVGWLCFNRPSRGQSLLSLNGNLPVGLKGVGLQGHHGQLLAILAQSKLVADYPLRVNRHKFTLQDLVKSEMLTCYAGEELTFKLISLAHYLPTDTQWKNNRGENWSIPRLISEEIQQPVSNQVACGGTHRLMGLSYAVYKRKQRGEPVDGQYARAEKYIHDFHKYAFSLQNPDGSFSTDWFRGRGARPDIERRIQTTGHILEWLVFSVPEEQLESPQMVRAVSYLTDLMYYNKQQQWKIGPLGHAVRALRLYNQRVFEARESDTTPDIAADHENVERAQRDAAPRTARLHPRVEEEVQVRQEPVATPQIKTPQTNTTAPAPVAPQLPQRNVPLLLQQPQSQIPLQGPQLNTPASR